MKINKEVSFAINNPQTVSKKFRDYKVNSESPKTIWEEKPTKSFIENRINNFKNTFKNQEELSKVQAKITALKNYQNDNNFDLLKNNTYNNKPLFNNNELNNIQASNNLSEVIKFYSKQEEDLNRNINSQLVQNESTNAVNLKNDIQKIKDYLSKTVGYTMKQESSTIIDLLK